MAVARDIIYDAFLLAGAMGLGETLSAEEANFGLTQLNDLTDTLALQPLACYENKEESFALVGGQNDYSTSLLTSRPNSINYVNLTNSGVTYNLQQISNQDYAAISYKSSGGIPDVFNFFIDYPTSMLRFYPSPIAGYTAIVGYAVQVANFASVGTTVTLPPGYKDMLTYQLALRMFAGREPYGWVVNKAAELLANVKRPNTPLLTMSSGVNIGPRQWNVYTGYPVGES